jgi:hypothetical protein
MFSNFRQLESQVQRYRDNIGNDWQSRSMSMRLPNESKGYMDYMDKTRNGYLSWEQDNIKRYMIPDNQRPYTFSFTREF